MSKYYCLVAGLPDLTLEDGKLSYTMANFKTDIYLELSKEDREYIDLFYLQFDNINLLKLLKKEDEWIDLHGKFSVDELELLITSVKDGDIRDGIYPSYLYDFISVYLQSFLNEDFLPENVLATYYYDYAMQCDNKFISSWFEFNQNINNILSALMARKYKVEVASNIVGHTETSDTIRTSSARDFGISGALEYFEPLMRISETEELVERERKIDILKWDWMGNATFFDYFTIERIFVFLLRLGIIERWISLDKEQGKEIFRKIIDSLKNEVQIPAEFR